MKTVREWLETLPSGYRERVLENLSDQWAERQVERLRDAIDLAAYAYAEAMIETRKQCIKKGE